MCNCAQDPDDVLLLAVMCESHAALMIRKDLLDDYSFLLLVKDRLNPRSGHVSVHQPGFVHVIGQSLSRDVPLLCGRLHVNLLASVVHMPGFRFFLESSLHFVDIPLLIWATDSVFGVLGHVVVTFARC